MKTSLASTFDHLFNHNIKNHIKNIIIYDRNDQWSVDQCIDEKDHEIWKELYNNAYSLAFDNGIDMYKNGITNFCNMVEDFSYNIPNLNNISSIINSHTGWQIKVVAGFVDEIIFFRLLRDKFFPSSDIIRQSKRFYEKYKNTNVRNDLSYTPEPDIFHEIFGHAPFLFSTTYCDLLQSIGELGCEILEHTTLTEDLKIHNLKRLQNFVWWTLEFGLMKSNNKRGFDIYGAGILSSSNEIENSIKSKNIIDYDIQTVIMTRFDYSELQDRYFLIDSFDYLVKSFKENKNLFLYNGGKYKDI